VSVEPFHDLHLFSQAVGRSMSVRVVVPPGFQTDPGTLYPVLYFLHPWGLSPSYLTDKLLIHEHLRRGVQANAWSPFIIVMPEGGRSFYLNAADPPGHDWSDILAIYPRFFEGALEQYGRYGDYLLHEVIPTIEERYPVRSDRRGRAIGGISMGGAAAAVHGFHRPDLFCAVGIHSPALFSGPWTNGGAPPWIFGLDQESFATRNPADVARQLTPAWQPRIFLDTGQDDPMRAQVEHLHDVLISCGLHHHFAIAPGGHNKYYWEPRLPSYLAFYAQEW